jgi:nicotinate phosphoribosyltransferase
VNTRTPLLTDLYQLTMASAYWKQGMHGREAAFHLFFRKAPFGSGYTIAAGLAGAIAYLRDLRFEAEELDYLRSLTGADQRPLFERAFLEFLGGLRFTCDVDAVPEGTVVYPLQPLLRVQGPILQAQLIETALLNILNFQSLVATKAARIVHAAQGRPVLEFGLRRAQGPDGGVSAARAAFVGGCEATSNVLAGQRFGIPVRGTHAHSWVMAFDDEPAAFEAYASAQPNNALFLVDTYDTLDGVRNAIDAGRRLRERGFPLLGIRLDSGDLAWLSIEARRLLDEAGFPDAKIVASNDLDEEIIESLISQGARIDIWGVGTKLATAYEQPALGGVYKLGAIRDQGDSWTRRIKVSEQSVKTTIPGILQVRRFVQDGEACGDMIFDTLDASPPGVTIVDPGDPTRSKTFRGCTTVDLLVPVFRQGRLVYESPKLEAIRANTARELATLSAERKRLANPHRYPVGLSEALHRQRTEMILKVKGTA